MSYFIKSIQALRLAVMPSFSHQGLSQSTQMEVAGKTVRHYRTTRHTRKYDAGTKSQMVYRKRI